jgi:hypothetical protein
MSDPNTQSRPAAKIQRQLRADESLIEMARAERVFRASREQTMKHTRNDAAPRWNLIGCSTLSGHE